MPPQYTIVNFKFDRVMFAAAVRDSISNVGIETTAETIGADTNTVRNWSSARFRPEFPYPSMTYFLRFCNLNDLDPRMFFVLEDDQ